MNFDRFLDLEIAGNTGMQYLWAIFILFAFVLGFYIFQKIVIARIKKACKNTSTDVDDFILNLFQNIKPPFYFFVALYIAAKSLEFKPIVSNVIFGAFIIVVVIQAILTIQKTIDYILKKKFIKKEDEDGDNHMFRLVGKIAKWSLWVIGGLMVLSNLGVNITSLVAGMGIGGIAIALAAQNILGDIFASFSIYFDKPFKIGDFIKVENEMGTVEKIGIKTTRIKTFSGEELVMPNKKLTDADIFNYAEMTGRRKVVDIGVAYETQTEKLEKIKTIIEEIFSKYEKEVRLERVHFKEFGESSLNFQMSFWVNDAAYVEYLNLQEKINYDIIKKFRQEGISMAYPTRTIYIGK